MTSASCGPVGPSSILSPIGTLGNPSCAQLGRTNTTATVAGASSSFTNDQWSLLHKEKRTADTTLLGWEPNQFFSADAAFRYAVRTVAFGDFTTGTTTTLSTSGVPAAAASGDDSNGFFPSTYHEKAGLFGVKLHPRDNWMINGDIELSYIDNPVAAILPGHSQVYKLRSNYRLGKWGSVAGFINNKLSRNSLFSADFALANPTPLTPVRHVDHNLNYGLSASMHPNEKFTLDFGWSYQDVFSTTGSCIPMTSGIVPQGGQISRCPAVVGAPAAPGTPNSGFTSEFSPYSGFNGVPAILHYQQNTNTGYVNIILQPVKRVSMLLGYEITSDTGDNTWLRADTLAPFAVPVDAASNVIYPANKLSGPRVGYALGPNPAVGQGPLGLNWQLPSIGMELGITKTLAPRKVQHGYLHRDPRLSSQHGYAFVALLVLGIHRQFIMPTREAGGMFPSASRFQVRTDTDLNSRRSPAGTATQEF